MTFWSLYARVYDLLLRYRPYTEQIERVVEIVRERFPRGAEVFDSGCGTGNYSLALNVFLYDVYGNEPCVAMHKRACRKADNGEGLHFYCTPRTPTGSIGMTDCVLSMNSLYCQPDPRAALSEFYRVLKPGSTLILSHPLRFPGAIEVVADYVRRYGLWATVKMCWHCWPLAPFHVVIRRRYSANLRCRKTIRRWLTAAGFKIVSIEPAYACGANILVVAEKPRA